MSNTLIRLTSRVRPISFLLGMVLVSFDLGAFYPGFVVLGVRLRSQWHQRRRLLCPVSRTIGKQNEIRYGVGSWWFDEPSRYSGIVFCMITKQGKWLFWILLKKIYVGWHTQINEAISLKVYMIVVTARFRTHSLCQLEWPLSSYKGRRKAKKCEFSFL